MAPGPTSTPVEIPNKLYFRIGEVGRLTGVKSHTLRYWETEFGRLRPMKSSSGQRRYSRADVELVLRIKDLLWGRKFTIAGARTALAKGEEKEPLPEPPQSLLEREASLDEQAQTLSDRGTEVAARESFLAGRTEDLARREAALTARAAELDARAASSAGREEAFTERARKLAEQEAALADAELDRSQREAEMAGREGPLSERERALSEREGVLFQREKNLEAQLRQAQEALAERQADGQRALDASLQEQLHEIDMLRTRARLLEARADEATSELDDVRLREARMTRAMAQVRRGIIELRHRLHEAGQDGS